MDKYHLLSLNLTIYYQLMKNSILLLILLKPFAAIEQQTIAWNGSAWSQGVPTALTFSNGQRVANNASPFFKTSQVIAQNNRIFLNVTSLAGDFSQMAINYATGAEQGVINLRLNTLMTAQLL